MKAILSNIYEPTSLEIVITGSKSESNRLLILQALYPNITIDNLSESDDTKILTKSLHIAEGTVDVHHAGTAMRFLIAYFASKPNKDVTLTGSERMQQRPIKILVDALRKLGADISYLKEEGFPPIRIKGKQLQGSDISIKASVSSQYISALMLIAPTLSKGLRIKLEGKTTSIPYIKMTLALLQRIGVSGNFSENIISILPSENTEKQTVVVESDWSSASYFYGLLAISKVASAEADKQSLTLSNYREDSLQGDAELVTIYKSFGISTTFNKDNNSITLKKTPIKLSEEVILDLNNTPDIAQTIAVTCFALKIGCRLNGLHTLKIKETDRLLALKTELEKLGAAVEVSEDSLILAKGNTFNENVEISTYNDHRMAMAFALLSKRFPLQINDPMVVTKSFPSFWEDIEKLGIKVEFE